MDMPVVQQHGSTRVYRIFLGGWSTHNFIDNTCTVMYNNKYNDLHGMSMETTISVYFLLL